MAEAKMTTNKKMMVTVVTKTILIMMVSIMVGRINLRINMTKMMISRTANMMMMLTLIQNQNAT